ncbi:MAG: hypothetical protein ACU0C8_14050, partial [Roseovarius sp.]
APSNLSMTGLPFTGDKAGFWEVDWNMMRGPALETGVFGFDNRKIPASKSLRYPHHIIMNNPG